MALEILRKTEDFLNTPIQSKVMTKKLFQCSVQEEQKSMASDPKSMASDLKSMVLWNPEWWHFQNPRLSVVMPRFSVPYATHFSSSWTLHKNSFLVYLWNELVHLKNPFTAFLRILRAICKTNLV